MSGTALDNPLVREYLRDLDAALARLPAAQASELREQITAHIADALPRDAADEQVAAVLARLGSPAELAAEAVGGPTTDATGTTTDATDRAGRAARRDDVPGQPPRRARRPWRSWRFWVTAGAVGVVVAVVTVLASELIAAETAPVLTTGGAESWWYAQDGAHEVDTSADGASQSTVPIRSGHWQGFVLDLFNDSDQTQTVLGPAYGNGLPSAFVGAGPPQGIIGVSTPNREVDEGSNVYSGVRFVLPGVIPPHQLRAMRVLWFSNTCLEAGGEQGSDEIALRVRVGWITRTEVIWLTQGWYVAGPSTGKYALSAPYCQ
jgi:hypothetical protein